jgi:hypothetical protein
VGLRDAMKQARYDQLHRWRLGNLAQGAQQGYDAFVKEHGTIKLRSPSAKRSRP